MCKPIFSPVGFLTLGLPSSGSLVSGPGGCNDSGFSELIIYKGRKRYIVTGFTFDSVGDTFAADEAGNDKRCLVTELGLLHFSQSERHWGK